MSSRGRVAAERAERIYVARTASSVLGWLVVLLGITLVGVSIASKSVGGETPIFAIFPLFLLPLAFRRFPTVKRIARIVRLLVPLAILAAVYLTQSLIRDDLSTTIGGVRTVGFIVLVGFAFVLGTQLGNLRISRLAAASVVVLAVFPGVVWVSMGNASSDVGTADGKNVVIGALVHLVFFVFFLTDDNTRSSGAIYFVVLVTVGVGAALLGQRVMLLLAVISLLVGGLGLIVRSGRSLDRWVSLALLSLGISVFSIIVTLAMDPRLSAWNELAVDLSGRRLNSGRDVLWPLAIGELQGGVWWGIGPSVIPRDYGTELGSWHNSFLQVAVQIGLVGMFLLFWQVRILIRHVASLRSLRWRAIGLAYVTIALGHAFFESFLISNSAMIAVLVWINFGLLVGSCQSVNGENVRRECVG